MGGERTSTNQSSQQQAQTTYTPTAEETAYNKLKLGTATELEPGLKALQQQGIDLTSNLLQGKPLPGYLAGLPGGISPEVTQSIVDRSIRDIQPSLAGHGLLDSGVNASISARSAADVRNQSEQFNLQNLMQLLNLGVGGQAQVQAPIEGFSGQLSNRLAGLRSSSSTGSMTGNSTVIGMNPFMKNLQSSFGQSIGSGTFGNSKGWFSA